MRKTMLLTHEYYPFRGGVARYCYNLFKNFDQKDYIVVTDYKDMKPHDNIIKTRIKYPLIKPSWLLSLFRIRHLIKKHKIEIIFTPNILPLGSIAYVMKKWLKLPYIISLHGLDIRLAIQNKPHIAKKILQEAERITVNSKSTEKVLLDFGIEASKVMLLYPSVSPMGPANKISEIKSQLKMKEDERILLTVGRLSERKGHDMVIKVMSELSDKYKIRYIIVGRGEEKDYLERLASKYGLMSKVSFLENVSDAELPSYYALADIFVMPVKEAGADIEGFGIVYIEAAQAGLPIIGGQSGGPVEIFVDNEDALLVSGNDIKALKEAVSRLLNNPKLAAKLASAGQNKAKLFTNVGEQSQKLAEIL